MKIATVAALTLLLSACATAPAPRSAIGLPNPASASCVQQGGRVDLRQDARGNVNGVCVFGDGRECEEWALFRDHQCVAPPAAKP